MRFPDYRCVGVVIGLFGFASPALAQTLGGAQAPDVSMVRVAFAFLFCVALAAAGAYVLRFRMTGRLDLPRFAPIAPRRMVLVERLRLGAQHELCLITFEGREFMVSVTPGGITRFDAFGEAGAAVAP